MSAASQLNQTLSATLSAFALAFMLCAVTLLVSLRLPKQRLIWDTPDRPNAMHTKPTPRIGGIAIATAVAGVVITPWYGGSLTTIMLIALGLLLVSFFDDRWQLSPALRFFVHVAAAALVMLLWMRGHIFSFPSRGAWSGQLNPIVTAVAVIGITWMTNLYNFMDGADGIAGGMSLFGFGSYMLVAMGAPITQGGTDIALISAAIAGAAAGFLMFNFSPAKVFMGDAGSIPLGFLAAALGIDGVLIEMWAWWFPFAVFSPFIVDATATLLKRVYHRKKIWYSHREHYYQRLILSGWSHRRTAATYYLVMFGVSASAIAALENSGETAFIRSVILLAWVVIYTLLVYGLERRFRKQ